MKFIFLFSFFFEIFFFFLKKQLQHIEVTEGNEDHEFWEVFAEAEAKAAADKKGDSKGKSSSSSAKQGSLFKLPSHRAKLHQMKLGDGYIELPQVCSQQEIAANKMRSFYSTLLLICVLIKNTNPDCPRGQAAGPSPAQDQRGLHPRRLRRHLCVGGQKVEQAGARRCSKGGAGAAEHSAAAAACPVHEDHRSSFVLMLIACCRCCCCSCFFLSFFLRNFSLVFPLSTVDFVSIFTSPLSSAG